MAAYNIYEAKTHFSALVDKAMSGEVIIIAKAGKPVARLVSVSEKDLDGSVTRRKGGRNLAGWESVPESLDDPLPEEMQRALGMLE